jgi:hypothetical protein
VDIEGDYGMLKGFAAPTTMAKIPRPVQETGFYIYYFVFIMIVLEVAC